MPGQNFVYETADAFSDLDLELPPFLIEPILPTGGIGFIFGSRSAGKTQLAFSIAKAVTAGSRLFDRYDCRKGRVAYFSVDMPILMVQKRIQSIQTELSDPSQMFVMAADSPIDVVGESPEIAWAKVVREWSPDLLIIDTLHKIHKLNENESESVTAVIRSLRHIFGDMAIVLIHHEVKETFFTKDRRDEHKQRGSTAWLDDTDLAVRVRKASAVDQSTVHVAFPRVRYCADQPPITTRMDPEARLLRVKPKDEMTAAEIGAAFLAENPAATQHDLYEFLRQKFAKSHASAVAKRLYE